MPGKSIWLRSKEIPKNRKRRNLTVAQGVYRIWDQRADGWRIFRREAIDGMRRPGLDRDVTPRDQKLVKAFERAAESMPPAFVSYADVMERTRVYRWRRVGTWSLAAAMFLVAGLAMVPALQSSITEDRVPPANYASTAATPTKVAQEWVDSLASGDLRAAWELLSPISRHHYGSFRYFEDEAKAWADGVGAWSNAPSTDWYETHITSTGDGTLYAVTVAGAVSVDQQGTTTWIVRALEGEDPKIETITHGAAFIEPKVPDGDPTSQDRAGVMAPETLPAKPKFRAEVAASAEPRVTFTVLGLDKPPFHYGPAKPEGRYAYAEWAPMSPLPKGLHVVQMVVEHDDGGIAAASALFEVGE